MTHPHPDWFVEFTPDLKFAREVLGAELRDRAPELAALAARIEALPLDDPRLVDMVQRGGEQILDMLTADEFASALEPFLDEGATRRLTEGVRFGPDFTHRFLADPAGRAQIAGIIAAHVMPPQRAEEN
jgi:hypothetical protein